MTKTEAISRMILDQLARSAAGTGNPCTDAVHVRAAIDAVLGEGTYDKLASDVYDELRAAAR